MASTRNKSNWLGETLKTIVYAVVIAIAVRTIAFEPFNIPSGSLTPTLLVGDYLFVSKYAYGYSRHSLLMSPPLFSGRILDHAPQRGDIAVFKLPTDNRTDYIKRVIGLPGDRIQVIHRVLYINGVATQRRQIEDYQERDSFGSVMLRPQYLETLPNGVEHHIIEHAGEEGFADNTIEYVVPAEHYFMMGDNRDNSQDSRYLDKVGYVPAENLEGRAEVVFFSTNGSAALWEVWKWPWAIRWSRLLNSIH